ncbi:MFS transporter [Aestuariivita boseongensis]|uniref:MFS transporter n=1 Tax=Aestuariivita boseongensis TaxID=1470562 RepID=UPI00068202FA|nr:MFS transporter [Aestuariivita boseongensis]
MTTTASPRLITLILLTASSTLSLNMFLPSLPAIAVAFDVPYGTATFAIAGYLAMTAVLALIIGPISDRIGRRPTALAAVILFLLASIGCVLAQSWTWFLIYRLGQGVMVSGFILASAVVRDTRDHADAASLLGYIAGAMAVAPLLGPMLGGVLQDAFGWRANFYVYAALGALLLIAIAIDLRETRIKTTGPRPGPGPLLRAPRFWAYALTMALSTCAFYGFLAGAPIVAAQSFGLSGTTLGIGLGSITAGFMAGSFTGARLSKRIHPDTVMFSGRVLSVSGLVTGLLALSLTDPSALSLFAFTLFIGLGNGLTTPTANAGALSVIPERSGTASGITGALTVGLGALTTLAVGWAMTATPTPTALLATLLAIKLASLATAWFAWRTPPASSL